jgi:pyruvate dehydrogenase E1 component
MYQEQEDVYYYITVMNENYAHPPMPEGVEKGILKGMYLFSEGKAKKGQPKVQLIGSGTILRELIAGAELLENDFGVSADIWSATSFNQLRRDGLETERWNMLHPEAERRISYVEQCLKDRSGPVIAASDYMKVFADQIRAFMPTHNFVALGTDGFGRSDTRKALRGFFEVDRHYVAVAAMKALADEEAVPRSKVTEAIRKYGIDPEKPDPTTV